MAIKIRTEYRPYLKEGLYCFLIDIVIIGIGSLGILIVSKGDISPFVFIYFLAYLIIECFFNYNIPIRILFECRYNKPEESSVKIALIDTEGSLSGWMGISVINRLYPKDYNVERYKIICFTSENKKIKVRSIMPEKKGYEIHRLIVNGKLINVKIRFGALSKILFEIIIYDKKNRETSRIGMFDNRL